MCCALLGHRHQRPTQPSPQPHHFHRPSCDVLEIYLVRRGCQVFRAHIIFLFGRGLRTSGSSDTDIVQRPRYSRDNDSDLVHDSDKTFEDGRRVCRYCYKTRRQFEEGVPVDISSNTDAGREVHNPGSKKWNCGACTGVTLQRTCEFGTCEGRWPIGG